MSASDPQHVYNRNEPLKLIFDYIYNFIRKLLYVLVTQIHGHAGLEIATDATRFSGLCFILIQSFSHCIAGESDDLARADLGGRGKRPVRRCISKRWYWGRRWYRHGRCDNGSPSSLCWVPWQAESLCRGRLILLPEGRTRRPFHH